MHLELDNSTINSECKAYFCHKDTKGCEENRPQTNLNKKFCGVQGALTVRY
jgi:hypothetical protein